MRMPDEHCDVLARMTSHLRMGEPYPTCATLYLDLATLDQLEHDDAPSSVVDPYREEDTPVLRWTLGGGESRIFAAGASSLQSPPASGLGERSLGSGALSQG